MPERREAPSLVDLCVNVAIDNVRYLGDAGETDLHLLDRILPPLYTGSIETCGGERTSNIVFHLFLIQLLFSFLSFCFLLFIFWSTYWFKGRVLSSVTDKLWKRFYEKQFGENNLNNALERMRQHNVSFKWKDLYQAKLTAISEKENEVAA